MSKVNIIPMAGLGSRFSEVGYKLPKPLIPVSGSPMILQAIRRIPKADTWIFIVRQEYIDMYAIDRIITNEIQGAVIVAVQEITEG